MDPADAALAAVRAIHFGAVLLLFGQFVYRFTVSPKREPGPGFRPIVGWCVAAALVTAILWVLLEAPRMSGLSIAQALGADTLWSLLTQTRFGNVALLRFILLSVLAGVLLRGGAFPFGAAITVLLLMTIAASGHAGAEPGAAGLAHFLIDSAHLLAAGAWLGALVPLILVLRQAALGNPAWASTARLATARFSTLGIGCVAVLLFSGVLNASYTVNVPLSVAFHTEYGRLLLLKVLAFVVIVALAAVNRTILMPRMSAAVKDKMDTARAARSLMRNALAESLLGFGIVAIVGMLGITVPAVHVHAAEPSHSHSHDADKARAPEPRSGPYVPGLGEIMTLQQMRHAKLWLAGSARNWALAAYELDELKEGFEDVARLYPTHDGVPVGEMAARLTAAPLTALEKAIQKKDAASFAASFDGLTAACNSCHRAANHAFIRIARPKASPFGNQIFTPASR